MKKFLILSVSLTIASTIFAQADTANANNFVDGVPEGKWIYFFDIQKGIEVASEDRSSPFYSVTMYHAGKRTGTDKEYYTETGEQWSEIQYSDNRKTIVWKTYYSNSKQLMKDSILDDKGHHIITTYFGDGKIDTKFAFATDINGTIKVQVQSPDRALGYELIGTLNGEMQRYDDATGNLKVSYLFSFDLDKIAKFDFEGPNKLWSIIVRGIKGSVQKDYNEKGIIKMETTYLNGEINGAVKEYYENGTIKTETNFSHKVLNGPRKTFDKNGKLESETPYVEGRITGVLKHYYPNGVVRSETMYEENNPVGETTLRDVDGNKIK